MSFSINTPRYGKVFVVADLFDDLRSVPTSQLQHGYMGITSAADTDGDKAGGLFVWDASSTDVDDNATVLAPVGASVGRWISVGKGEKGDGLDTVMSATGSSLVGYKKRTVKDKLDDTFSVKDYGIPALVGIGQHIPLSSVYATLAAAQADFPFATDLTGNLDWACLQKACNDAESSIIPGKVVIPNGLYMPNKSVLVPSDITIEGTNAAGSIISNQYVPLADYQFKNKDSARFVGNVFRNLTSKYSNGFLKVQVSGSCSLLEFHNIRTIGSTESDFRFNMLETSLFSKCQLQGGGSGHRIHVEAFPCNSNTLVDTRLTDSGGAIYIRGGENFHMFGGSIEGGGTATGAAIDVDTGGAYIKNIVFNGVYFESISRYVLKCPAAAEGIAFRDCHFTGSIDWQSLGGFNAPQWQTNDAIITFDSNDFAAGVNGLTTSAPKHAMLLGRNKNLIGTDSNVYRYWDKTGGKVHSARRQFVATTTGTFNAYQFTRPSVSAGADNQHLLFGTLTVMVQGFTASGGSPVYHVFRKMIGVRAYGASLFDITPTDLTPFDASGNTFIVTIGATGGGLNAILTVSVSGTNGAGLNSVSTSFEFDQHAYNNGNEMTVTVL